MVAWRFPGRSLEVDPFFSLNSGIWSTAAKLTLRGEWNALILLGHVHNWLGETPN
jgi:hypothetical protein